MTQYSCAQPHRRDLVAAAVDDNGLPFLNGIDYLEVDPADQRTLAVHFVHPLPGQPGEVPVGGSPLAADNLTIDGGERITGVRVETVVTAGQVVTLHTDVPGDFSTYTLVLRSSPAVAEPPPGFDPMLAGVRFSFKVDCGDDIDCGPVDGCLPPEPAGPHLSYLARDYASFRRLILDRLSVVMPDWTERSPADLGLAVVEILAYVGDHLSYFQDSVATEAYLGIARRRPSLRRHARLVDYPMHDGANARAWLVFETTTDRGNPAAPVLPAGSVVVAARPDGGPEPAAGAVTFETMHELVTVTVARNAIDLYTWGDEQCCLPAGATRASVAGSQASLDLHAGDVLLFEEVLGADSGLPADADPTHRHAVRLSEEPFERVDPLTRAPVVDIVWHAADALPFPLCLAELDDGTGTVRPAAVARGNVVLADHGRTMVSTGSADIVPALVPADGRYRPVLDRPGITQAAPYDATAAFRPAAAALAPDRAAVVPAIALRGEGEAWEPRRDLLGSDRFAAAFVAETEEDGSATLRFGDDVHGRRPSAGATFSARFRVGTGTAGNVGAEALSQLVPPIDGVTIRNPMAATGGAEPEPARLVRLYAPQAFRTQERAVTEADYADMARRHPDVQRAAATRRWTGSWYTMFVTVDRHGGAAVDADFEAELRRFLERFRMAGVDLEIDGPHYVPIDLALTVCIDSDHDRSAVGRALHDALGSRTLPGGDRGFFHPDNLTFGQPVYLSQIVARAMAAPGVRAVVGVTRFQRFGDEPHGELESGVVPVHRLEIARLDDDPSLPEQGRLELALVGGDR